MPYSLCPLEKGTQNIQKGDQKGTWFRAKRGPKGDQKGTKKGTQKSRFQNFEKSLYVKIFHKKIKPALKIYREGPFPLSLSIHNSVKFW